MRHACATPRCRIEPYLIKRRRAAAPVRRSPRRALPWEARPARPRRPGLAKGLSECDIRRPMVPTGTNPGHKGMLNRPHRPSS